MRFLRVLAQMCILVLSAPLFAAQTVDSSITIGQNSVHYGVYEAEGERIGDILYFHGFGDRFQNHATLFASWNSVGFRVIGFDLPSHGQTTAKPFGSIDFHSFESLSDIARITLAAVRSSSDDHPLLFAGWSLGGLLATRILQNEDLRNAFPEVAGLMLYAPAVAPKKCVGNFLCRLSNETLCHNKGFAGRELKPMSPLEHLPFSARILANSASSWHPPLPADLQILIFAAGDDDSYVNTPFVIRWVGTHRSNHISRMSAYQCAGAYHELDNEPEMYGGDFVRDISRDFAIKIAEGLIWKNEDGEKPGYLAPCEPF